MTDFRALLTALNASGVEFIVVGGVAATAHGVARLTLDLDIVYRRTPGNIGRLVAAISALHPYLRGAPGCRSDGMKKQFEAVSISR